MKLLELLDRVPRRYRPIPGIVGALVILGETYHLDPPHSAIAYMIVTSAVGVGAWLGARAVLRRLSRSPAEPLKVRALEIEVGGSQEERSKAVISISQLLKERSKAGRARYLTLSTLEGGLSRSLIVVSGVDEHMVNVEYEVLKTLLAVTYSGVRIREVSDEINKILTLVAGSLGPSGRGEPLFVPAVDEPHIPVSTGLGIYIGRGFDGAFEKEVYLKLSDLAGHVGIFGSTGTGKTTTLGLLAAEARSLNINVVVLDWAGEVSKVLKSMGVSSYRELSPLAEASVNPFKLEEFRDRQDLLIDVLSKALGLSQPQTYILMRVLDEWKPKDIVELARRVEEYPEEARWDRDVKRGLLRRVDLLSRKPMSQVFLGNASLAQLEEGLSVVRMDMVDSIIARRAYGLLLLASMFLRRGRERPTLVAIDEAHNLVDDEDLLGQIMAESRKYGLYVAIATQSPATVPNGVLLNTNTKIVHALRSLRDKEVIEHTMALRPEFADRVDKLAPGEAIIQAPSLSSPVIVKVEFKTPSIKELSNPIAGEPVYTYANVPRSQLG